MFRYCLPSKIRICWFWKMTRLCWMSMIGWKILRVNGRLWRSSVKMLLFIFTLNRMLKMLIIFFNIFQFIYLFPLWIYKIRLIIKHLVCQLFELIIEIGNFLNIFICRAIINTQLCKKFYCFSLLNLQRNIFQQLFQWLNFIVCSIVASINIFLLFTNIEC